MSNYDIPRLVEDLTVLGLLPGSMADLYNHIGSGGAAHAVVTTSVNGFMSAADKAKLDAATPQFSTDTLVSRTASGHSGFSRVVVESAIERRLQVGAQGSFTSFAGGTRGAAVATNTLRLLATDSFSAASQNLGYIGRFHLQGNAFDYVVRFTVSARGTNADPTKTIRYEVERIINGPTSFALLPDFRIYEDPATSEFYFVAVISSANGSLNYEIDVLSRTTPGNFAIANAAPVFDPTGKVEILPYDTGVGRTFSNRIYAPRVAGLIVPDAASFATPAAVGNANAEGSASTLSRSDHVHAHGNQSGGALHSVATTSAAGFMSAADKIKLNGIATGATNNPEIFNQPFPGNVNRQYLNKLRERVSVWDFGAVGDGVTDDRNAFQAALDYVASLGGGVVHFDGNHAILSSFSIPELCTLEGPNHSAGQIVHVGSGAADYDSKAGVLKVSGAATINIGASACLFGAIIVRFGMDLPYPSAAAAQSGVLGFAGTAITIMGMSAEVNSCLILGFEYAIHSVNYARHKFIDVLGDCTNGIYIQFSQDISYLRGCHFWPFLTANYSWTADDPTGMILTRTGAAFTFQGTVDWGKMDSCFEYGYFRGFRLADVAACTLINCAADGPMHLGVPAYTGSIGFLIEGVSHDNKIIGATAQGKQAGYQFAATSGNYNETIGCNAAGNVAGVMVTSGDASLIGGMYRANQNSIAVSNNVSNVASVGQTFRSTTTAHIVPAVATDRIRVVQPNSVDGTPIVANLLAVVPSIAAAATIHAPPWQDAFNLTGTGTVSILLNGWPGRKISIRFAANATVQHGIVGNGIKLAGNVNFVGSANAILSLYHDGDQWYEVSRSI